MLRHEVFTMRRMQNDAFAFEIYSAGSDAKPDRAPERRTPGGQGPGGLGTSPGGFGVPVHGPARAENRRESQRTTESVTGCH